MANKIPRTLHYFEMKFTFHEDVTVRRKIKEPFKEFFSNIAHLGETKDKLRYQLIGGHYIFVQNVRFDKSGSKRIRGLLRCVRKDLLPEIMNTTTDEARGLAVLEEEGLVETAHFVIDYSRKVQKLAFEYNMYGARVEDFLSYCYMIGTATKWLQDVGHNPIIRDELDKVIARMGSISSMIFSVHKDNVDELNNIDNGIYVATKATADLYNPEYVDVTLKFDVKNLTSTNVLKKSIKNIVQAFRKDSRNQKLFNTLRCNAEDSDNGNKMKIFDLLINKLTSKVSVAKTPNYRTVISADMFEKMESEMYRLRI